MPELLSEEDFTAAATELGCDVASIHAVSEVESLGNGFLPDGRAKLLFESHQFHLATGGKYDRAYPNLSTPTWVSNYGPAGTHQYDRLRQAEELDADAALKSASWGRYQIMGSNFAACGYATVQEFVVAMQNSEKNHLKAFVAFLKHEGIDKPLAAHDWNTFARKYNGPGYRKHDYQIHLANAFKKYSQT